MALSISQKIAIYSAAAFITVGAGYGATNLLEAGGEQSTNDAHVTADYTLVAPKVAGFISQVTVSENQHVHAGQLLALIDNRDYESTLKAAQAGVAAAKARIAGIDARLKRQQAAISEALASIQVARADLVFARHNFERYSRLARQGAGTVEMAQQARAKEDTAQAHLIFDEAAVTAARQDSLVLKANRDQADAQLARADAGLDKARLNLSYTRIVAPIDGIIGRWALRRGAFVSPGTPLLAVVPIKWAYVVGNFLETQLAHVHPGQPVRITIDTFPGTVFRGRVESISPATGSTFSAIQPSNATGNFTKITQRIPVKVVFEPGQPGLNWLRAGMSAEVTITTSTARNKQLKTLN